MTDLHHIMAAAAEAAPILAATAPRDRARALVAVADRLDHTADQIVRLGQTETGLTETRLRGELNRTTCQMRLFAEVVVEGAYLDARIDDADPNYVTGPRPDLRRINVPVGPVLVFAASNFPLAFSVAGGDTAAALAAGCPVVVKAHDGHLELSELTASLVRDSLRDAGFPDGSFGLIRNRDDAVAALRDGRIRAASFTGSTSVGRMLADIAATRPIPIPFYGELGSVNPVIVTPAALQADSARLVQGYVASVTGSAGQLCTKPGFCFVPDIESWREPIATALSNVTAHRLLTPSISSGYDQRRSAVLDAPGVEILTEGSVDLDTDGFAQVSPTIVAMSLDALEQAGDSVLDETFGPLSILVSYEDLHQLPELVKRLFPGNLTATVHLADDEDLGELEPLVSALTRVAGRVLFDGWPTGVSVTSAMQHGGPYPATTTDATSVGTAAIGRFMRSVAYQDAPSVLLPAGLRDDNPWNIPQRRSAAGLSAGWGSLSGAY